MCKAIEDMMADAEAEGVSKGKNAGKKEMAINLADEGFPIEKIAKIAKVSVSIVQEWLSDTTSSTD